MTDKYPLKGRKVTAEELNDIINRVDAHNKAHGSTESTGDMVKDIFDLIENTPTVKKMKP